MDGDEQRGRRYPTNILDPHRQARSDDANAFMPDPEETGEAFHVDDDIAETLAQEFVQAATSGQDAGEETQDMIVEEEFGGPFIETLSADEFAAGTDEMNPADATREPLPRATSGMFQSAEDEGDTEGEDGEER